MVHVELNRPLLHGHPALRGGEGRGGEGEGGDGERRGRGWIMAHTCTHFQWCIQFSWS